jgi:cytochrome P450
MRVNPPVPLLLPRFCRETYDIGGYEVTKGTRVIVNTWALARRAEVYKPKRFMASPVGYDRGTQFDNLPFGGGRRMCPSDVFALAVLEIIVARLLYYLDLELTRRNAAARAGHGCD